MQNTTDQARLAEKAAADQMRAINHEITWGYSRPVQKPASKA